MSENKKCKLSLMTGINSCCIQFSLFFLAFYRIRQMFCFRLFVVLHKLILEVLWYLYIFAKEKKRTAIFYFNLNSLLCSVSGINIDCYF
jgi:hypothetical protein